MGMYNLIIYILNCIAVYYYTLFLGAGVGTGRVAVCFDSHPLMPRFPFSSPHMCIMEYGGGPDPLPMPPSAMPRPITSQPALLQPMLQLISLLCWWLLYWCCVGAACCSTLSSAWTRVPLWKCLRVRSMMKMSMGRGCGKVHRGVGWVVTFRSQAPPRTPRHPRAPRYCRPRPRRG